MAALTILTTEIRQLDGLYSLNDLHQAAGRKAKHRTNYFLNNEQTKDLISEIQTAGIPAVKTKEGKGGGTYVCRELVYAYAMWISAKFHLQVIRAFDAQHSTIDRAEYLAEIKREFEQQYRELKKLYSYPSKLLAQPGFTSPDGVTKLELSMLANTRKFVSPLFGLLNELRADGHDVTAPLAEAEAMREHLIKADEAFNQIWQIALKTQLAPAKTALRK